MTKRTTAIAAEKSISQLEGGEDDEGAKKAQEDVQLNLLMLYCNLHQKFDFLTSPFPKCNFISSAGRNELLLLLVIWRDCETAK